MRLRETEIACTRLIPSVLSGGQTEAVEFGIDLPGSGEATCELGPRRVVYEIHVTARVAGFPARRTIFALAVRAARAKTVA